MALTIKMRIDEHPEHSYVFSTGDGGQIELIPLSVVQNGTYTPEEGKAYNLVTVNVPETELEHLNITANGTYTAEDGTAYDVVTVNVQPILEAVTRSYTANGTYTIVPSEGNEGISGVTVNVNVPTPQPDLQSKSETYTTNGSYTVTPDSGYDGLSEVEVDVNVPTSVNVQASKSQTITQNGTVTVSPDNGYDAMEEAEITVNVPTGGNVQASKSQTITQNGTVTVSPDSGYDAMEEAEITVNVPTGGGGGIQRVTGSITTSASGDNTENIGLPSNITVRGFRLYNTGVATSRVAGFACFPHLNYEYTCYYEYFSSSSSRRYDKENLNTYPTQIGTNAKSAFVSETDGLLHYRCGSSNTLAENATYNYEVLYEEN